jgi:hypothetical protein
MIFFKLTGTIQLMKYSSCTSIKVANSYNESVFQYQSQIPKP